SAKALVSLGRGDLGAARGWIEQGIEISRRLGAEHPEYAEDLVVEARVEQAERRWASAAGHYREALAIFGKTVSRGHRLIEMARAGLDATSIREKENSVAVIDPKPEQRAGAPR